MTKEQKKSLKKAEKSALEKQIKEKEEQDKLKKTMRKLKKGESQNMDEKVALPEGIAGAEGVEGEEPDAVFVEEDLYIPDSDLNEQEIATKNRLIKDKKLAIKLEDSTLKERLEEEKNEMLGKEKV